MTASGAGLTDTADRWFAVSSGDCAGESLMRGSARVQAETDGYTVVAWIASKKNSGPVWRGIDPFRAQDVVDQINAGTKSVEILKSGGMS